MEKEESKIEKYSMKFQRISMISIFILSLFTFIYDTTPIYAVVAQKNNPITVANVNIIDIVSSYSTSTFTFSGKFSLQGKMGQQNDVIYGILVLGKNNTILDAKELGIVPHINEDENQKYTFSYTISPFIKGDINVFLIANTSAGLTLSASQIFQGNILGKEINFPCSYIEKTRTDKSKIECVSSKNQLLNMEYRKGSVLTASIIKETVILEPNKKITVSPNIEPGEYFIIITTPTNEKRIFPFTKDGDYGVISSVVVHTSDIKNKIETVILSQVSTSSIVSIRLISAKGEICGNEKADLKGVVTKINIITTCKTGNITVTLTDKEGLTLDTLSQPFSVINVSNITTTNFSNNFIFFNFLKNVLLIITIVLSLLGIIYFRKKYKESEKILN